MITALFNHRIRGFRTLNVVFSATLLVLAVGVNLAKTIAGRERNEIGRVESDIGKERQRIRVLEAEVAHLEQPERLERLARGYLDMAPAAARQEASVDALPEVAGRGSGPVAQPVSTFGVAVP
ncbi:MAG: cell division protein [Caulobacter sp.]|nr:cell division protein [Caulobacter sp.]